MEWIMLGVWMMVAVAAPLTSSVEEFASVVASVDDKMDGIGFDFDEDVVKNTSLTDPQLEMMEPYQNLVFFVTNDDREGDIPTESQVAVALIASTDRDTKEMRLVFLPTDTGLNLAEGDGRDSIRELYAQGGPAAALTVMNRELGLNLTKYVTVNWEAVSYAVNTLGGVEMEMSEEEFYYFNAFVTDTVRMTGIGSQHLKSAGMNYLDGVQASTYCRLRLKDQEEFQRHGRQLAVLTEVFRQLEQADIGTVYSVMTAVTPQMATNLEVEDVIQGLITLNGEGVEAAALPSGNSDSGYETEKGTVEKLELSQDSVYRFLFE